MEGPTLFDEDGVCAESKVRDSLSGLRVQQFRQAVLAVRYWVQTSIFVRKTLSVRLRDRRMRSILQARRAGPAFFDEDGVCAKS
jgi:hypothetical protein